ncbi:hypothetical protein H0H93_003961, partial [Arthromyces matolae]
MLGMVLSFVSQALPLKVNVNHEIVSSKINMFLGLAETAVLSDASSTGIPDSFFHFFNPNGDASSRHVRPGNVHVFTILSRILNDPELGNAQNTGIKMFSD